MICVPTHLATLEIFAVKMSSDHDASRGLRVLRGDHIREMFPPHWRVVLKLVLLDLPIQGLHSVNDVLPDLGIALSIDCTERETWRAPAERVLLTDARNKDLGHMRGRVGWVHLLEGVLGGDEGLNVGRRKFDELPAACRHRDTGREDRDQGGSKPSSITPAGGRRP